MISHVHAGGAFGRYRVQRRLGGGGMGDVFLAEDARLGRQVALKLLRDDSPDALQRLEVEARAASRLNHPNILTVYDIGEHEGTAYIATEYVAGETLRTRLARGPIENAEALSIAAAVAGALAAAHDAGILHRDVKPENVMVRPDGIVKLLDFGIAARIAAGPADASAETVPAASNAIAGTLRYMSPEQASGTRVDARTDVFSLGVVLYEMLTGRPPFDGTTPGAIVVSILNDPAPSLARGGATCPASVERVVRRALAKRAEDRYADMRALAADLEALRADASRASGLESPSGTRDAATVVATNLPVQPTALVGREQEIDVVQRVLEDPQTRLVTITGPGGTGKTRLAVEVARRAASAYPDGVHFVPFAAVQDAALILPTIAQTLGLKETADSEAAQLLAAHLRERRMLIVLDNLEHLPGAAAAIADLVTAAPPSRFLVTSRAALRLRSEREVPLLPLEIPDGARLPALDALRRCASVALFVERARAVRPDFTLTADNAEAVAEICARLDGLPLAIELAAARVNLLTPQSMVSRLSKRLPLLKAGLRDLPERQRTLADTIAWSYNLLGPGEQSLFDRLSLFAGGFTLEAAEAVGGAEHDVLEALDTLVSNSLLVQREAPDGTSRFSLLETIREFGAERLEARGAAAGEAHERHASWYLQAAETANAELLGDRQAHCLDRLELEHDNFRAGIDWALRTRRVELACSFGVALWRFWQMRGFAREGLARLEAILAAGPSDDTLRAKITFAAGVLADMAGDYARASARFEENLERCRQAGDRWGTANSLNNLGIIALRQQDYARARELYLESLTIWRGLDHRAAVALSLNNLGKVAHLQKDHDGARELHEESLSIFQQLRDRRGEALALAHLGDVERDAGHCEAAERRYAEALGLFEALGQGPDVAACLTDLGRLATTRREPEKARTFFQEALVVAGQLGDGGRIARVLEAVSEMAASEGAADRAVRLAGAASALRDSVGAPLPRAEQLEFHARIGGTERVERLPWLREGQAMSPDAAIQYALET